MARSSSTQCDLVASYMDGVHVKIAEAYKPPRKIGLPAAYNNRLPDVSKLVYDFSLERSVLEKVRRNHLSYSMQGAWTVPRPDSFQMDSFPTRLSLINQFVVRYASGARLGRPAAEHVKLD